MEIRTSKEIKIISSNLREIHNNEMSGNSKDRFNEFQFTRWVEVEDIKEKLEVIQNELLQENNILSTTLIQKLLQHLSSPSQKKYCFNKDMAKQFWDGNNSTPTKR